MTVTGGLMPKIQDEILDTFFQELEKTEGFTAKRVEKLRALFKSGKKPKALDLVKVLSDETEGQIQ